MADNEKQLTLSVMTKHQAAVKGLVAVGGSLRSIGDSAKRAQSSLKGITAYQELVNQTKAAGAAWKEAKNKVSLLSAEIKKSNEQTSKQASELKRAEKATEGLKTKYEKARDSLTSVRKSLISAGVDTKNLASEQVRLGTAFTAAKKQAIAATKIDMARGILDVENPRKAQQEIKRLQAAYKRLETAEMKGKISSEELARAKQNLKTKVQALTNSSGRLSGSLADVNKYGGILLRTLGPLAGALSVKSIIDSAVGWEQYKAALTSVLGSQEQANEELSWLAEVSEELGLKLESTAESYTQVAASAKGTALQGAATRDIFYAVAGAMAKLGKTSSDTDGALLAISQMMSKGKVSSEELRQQLGERLPGAFQLFAKAAGVSTKDLDAMLQSGEVGIDILPKFADELKKAFDIDGSKITTAQAEINRFSNTLLNLKLTLADSGMFSAFISALEDLNAQLKDKGLIENIRQLGDSFLSISDEGDGLSVFIATIVEGFKLLALGAQTVLAPIKLLGEVAAATFAAISFAIEGDFANAMRVLEDTTPGDKFRDDLDRLEVAVSNLGTAYQTVEDKAKNANQQIAATGQEAISHLDGLTNSINEHTKATTQQAEALAGAAVLVNGLAEAETKHGESLAELEARLTETARKSAFLDSVFEASKDTIGNLKKEVSKTGDAYWEALRALDGMTKGTKEYAAQLVKVEQAQKAFISAKKRLGDEEERQEKERKKRLFDAEKKQLEETEQALKNSYERRKIQLEKQLQDGIISRDEYAYQVIKAEADMQAEIMQLREQAVEKSAEILGKDTEQYKQAVQEKIDAELDLQRIKNERQETLDDLGSGGSSSSRRGRRGESGSGFGSSSMTEGERDVRDGVYRKPRRNTKIGETQQEASDRYERERKAAEEKIKQEQQSGTTSSSNFAGGFYGQWDSITNKISGITSLDALRAYQNQNRGALGIRGQLSSSAFTRALNKHATDLYRQRLAELGKEQKAKLEANLQAQISDLTSKTEKKETTKTKETKQMTLRFQSPSGQTVSGSFSESDASKMIEILRQAGMITV